MSIVIIGVLAAVLLNRLVYCSEAAEKAAMESNLRLIKTGLQIQLAELITTHRQRLTGGLESENPTRWLEHKPGSYGGRWGFSASPLTWYFDESARQLVYVVNSRSRPELDTPGPLKILRFQARLLSDRSRPPAGRWRA